MFLQNSNITFIVGDNGMGKSTLLETIGFRLQLPHMDGSGYQKSNYESARKLTPYLEIQWGIEKSIGFFFRAEDFGDLMNSVERADINLGNRFDDLREEVPEYIINQMKDSANSQLHHMRKNYGQELQSFSHGEAYLHILKEKINRDGIYLLDEPEAALSPLKQLSLIYFLNEHLQSFRSQFIITTHSPILMAYPGAKVYEVRENDIEEVHFSETEHYSMTKSFLNNPSAYLRFLNNS